MTFEEWWEKECDWDCSRGTAKELAKAAWEASLSQVKLYAFHPDKHGPYSYFVMALSKEDAINSIEFEIKHSLGSSYVTDPFIRERETYNDVEVYGLNEVDVNDNP